jgi:hypothetical protein
MFGELHFFRRQITVHHTNCQRFNWLSDGRADAHLPMGLALETPGAAGRLTSGIGISVVLSSLAPARALGPDANHDRDAGHARIEMK